MWPTLVALVAGAVGVVLIAISATSPATPSAADTGPVVLAAADDEPDTATAPVAPRDTTPAPDAEADDASPSRATADTTAPTAPVPFEEQAADPVGVRIPTLDVDAPTIPLGKNADDTIEVPGTSHETGWWQGGPEPGEAGPAVLLGHVDSYEGPAVFHRLRDIEPGALIHVDRADGTTVTFEVDRVEQHGKDDFPTDRVYNAPRDESLLRLVTCGGVFDDADRRYLDNVIVFAHRVPLDDVPVGY